MKCSVFRSESRQFTYIYLLAGKDFDELPDELRVSFGQPVRVIDLELTAGRKLAYADATQVMHELGDKGYYLQLPPKEDATGLLDLPDNTKHLA